MLTSAALMTAGGSATAAEAPCATFEVTPPPASVGADASMLRGAAEAEMRDGVQASLRRDHRRVIISLAVVPGVAAAGVCNVNATVRDARTGAMLAIIETNARADGPVSAEGRKLLAYSAVRNAVRRVPSALKKK